VAILRTHVAGTRLVSAVMEAKIELISGAIARYHP
jgi:hypothetical protein